MGARIYRFTVEGELSDRMTHAFPGMTLKRGDGVTTLSGEMRDQAELQGVFQRVSDLGLTLLETKSVRSAGRSGRDPVKATAGRERSAPQKRSER
jgi:hypothetical protein